MKDILNYYIDYEEKNMFAASTLKNMFPKNKNENKHENLKFGEEFDRDIYKNSDKISKIIENKKINFIENLMSKKCKLDDTQQKNLKNNITEFIRGNNKGEFINEFSKEHNKKIYRNQIYEIINDNSIIICDLLLEKKDDKRATMIFECEFENNELKLQKYSLNRDSMMIILSFLEEVSYQDYKNLFIDKFNNIMNNISNIQNQENIEEILKIIDTEIFKVYDNKIIKSINDFKGHFDWRRLDRIFITTEKLNEIYKPIFKEEIEIVKDKIGDSNYKNNILNQYIKGKSKKNSFKSIEKNFKFHMGSYTGEYPINEKQWHVVNEVNNINLLSVNGPPGTGKTTLLKEIIADNIVKKAKKLSVKIDEKWKTHCFNDTKIFCSPFDGENSNSIVITSSNNKAVDNIGKELLEEVGYFSEYAEAIDSQEIEYNGLLCGRLGNSKNMKFFTGQVLEALIKGLKHNEDYEVNQNIIENFNKVYNELINIQDKLENFYKERVKLLKNINIYENELANIDQMWKEVSVDSYKYENKSDDLNKKIFSIEESQKKLKDKEIIWDNIEIDINENKKAIDRLRNNLETYNTWKKFKFLKIFIKKLEEFFNEYPSDEYILDEIKNKSNIKEDLNIKKSNIEKEIKLMKEEIEIRYQEKHNLEKELEILNENLRKSKLNQMIINDYKKESEKIDILLGIEGSYFKNLYTIINQDSNNKILKLRKESFDWSLRVYEEYIKKHSKEIIWNLGIISEKPWFKKFYDSRYKYSNDKLKSIKYLWETLFICFPVITTTVHAFGKSTFHMIENYIDLLLVDEAGQIIPHTLVSPIYRSRRCVIVGDVKQLSPIVNLKENIILNHKQIDDNLKDYLCIEKNSAQKYADRNSDIYENNKDELTGIILNEHRRCENSIAKFSNDYVYNGCLKIVNEDNHEKAFGKNNVFFDVRGEKSKININKVEVAACVKIVEKLVNKGINKNDIGIITPFYNQKEALIKAIDNVDIGTIHAFQGQEKKYIIITTVLDDKSSGLINFVGNKPNLINVAVTRAKNQIIIVGNYEVALNSNNYLSNLVKVIKERGYIYSIYDTELSNNIPSEFLVEGMNIFADSFSIKSDLNSILENEIDGNFIIGPKKHYEVLKKLLLNTMESIHIVSPWINHYVVNEEIMGIIENATKRDVKINIYFGYNQNGYSIENLKAIVDLDLNYNKFSKDKDFEVLKKLKLILKERLIYNPPIHTKMLLIDEKYLIIGSHNWLSNNGNAKMAKEELSIIISDLDKVNYIKGKYFKIN